jgi:hypothetical protein
MIEPLNLVKASPLPRPPLGWFNYGYAALNGGYLALVRANHDFRNLPREIQSLRWPNARLRLSSLDEGVETDATEVPTSEWPIVDRLADGRWLVVAARARPGDMNGRLFDARGAPAGSFAADDAVRRVACTPAGVTWIGYFDERDNASALIAFDGRGEQMWALAGEPYALDCYALSATGDEAWACTYPDFPIIRVAGTVAQSWMNDIDGASAIAGKDKHVILAGGYNADKGRVVLLRLGVRAEPVATFHWPAIMNRPVFVGGRDGVLHAVADGQWLRLAIGDWVAALG